MILYPTETIYALGVNALDEVAVAELFVVKGRDEGKVVSWLVRDMADVARWGKVSEVAAKITERFLPGSLTLVLEAKDTVPLYRRGAENEVSFRISPDPVAQKLIADFMSLHDAPLTCTSANVSGMPTLPTVPEILAQFQQYHRKTLPFDWKVLDSGPRTGAPSTVVLVVGEEVTILREGAVSAQTITQLVAARS